MLKRFLAIVLIAVVGIFSVGATTQNTSDNRDYVKTWVEKPDTFVKKKKKFKPEGQPSVSEVHEIINHEQKKWGGPSISNRVGCESGYRWNATNGQYRGLLQFGSIWGSMYPGTPRKVKIADTKTTKKRVWRYFLYEDGTRERVNKGKIKVKVRTKKVGKLPSNADPYHGWAAVRVGQRAVSGDGPTTGWSCPV